MFDWRELLLRNQSQAAQTDGTTLKMVEEQLLDLLPPIVGALNATANLPLEPTWFQSEIAQKFKLMLEGVEQQYLVAWNHVRNAQIQKLEEEYRIWYQKQLRSDKSLYRTYCQWQDLLIQQHAQGWFSWILLGLKAHPFPTRELKKGHSFTPETELLLAEFFRCAKPLIQTDTYAVLKDFYSFQAIFTQQSPFLPQLVQGISNSSEKEIFEKLEENEFVEAARIFWDILIVGN
ncbi:MAG: hypothetical protein CMN54_09630 [SAR324 cluster bacterium]|uniref:Uncharacterized protein n=1 Tax=SAR324 cluster bacterium TaxID=2024889 RepID=A0A2D6YKF8_9DELT|nr:hypothetical protein [SAR324 cluster bacterium]